MPSKTVRSRTHAPAQRERMTQRKKVAFTGVEADKLAREAKASGMTEAKYMRQAVLAVWGADVRPKRKRSVEADTMAHAIQHMAFQVNKLGTNVNQIAKQVNTGLVPVTRNEVQYLLNQHQMLLSRAIAAMETVLA